MSEEANGDGDHARDLLAVAVMGDVETMSALLAKGADVNAVSHTGQTAFSRAHYAHAIALEETDSARIARARAVIHLLYRAGARDP
jgi:ankyrin repeat protein